ncbi:hypothetical protein L208DRAFT_1453149 [Tricholoma matsutake]|nr:hypothetical protein L208DRAFT_1453149 [Tricholoma matsutake 945]
MANPRQRRKSRSSSYKPTSHSRHAKRNLKKTPTIRGPKVLQDVWDCRKTVKQNYATLGLIHTLNPSSGGVEPVETRFERDVMQGESVSQDTDSSAAIPKGFGRITRDEAGQVLHIEMAEGEDEDCHPGIVLDMGASGLELDDPVLQKWTKTMGVATNAGPNNVVRALERISTPVNHHSNTLSAGLTGAGGRHSSMREISYLKKLVSVYGVDVERMAKDRKLNAEQRTTGELRRALRRAGLHRSVLNGSI